MLEANIQIHKDLVVKAYRRAWRYKALRDISYFYAIRLLIVWMVAGAANNVTGKSGSINFHLTFIILWVIAVIHGFIKWHKDISRTMTNWDFNAVLDYSGVTTKTISENNYKWNFYKNYQEYEDYLQINDFKGGITFLPKTPELCEIIEFTKSNIPKK